MNNREFQDLIIGDRIEIDAGFIGSVVGIGRNNDDHIDYVIVTFDDQPRVEVNVYQNVVKRRV